MQNKPKIIHYCWFGPKKLPKIEQECIQSWKRYLPDYELKLWNETSFDLSHSVFATQAYEAKLYAYVSDYVRTEVLYKFGGTYLDTDMEILPGFKELIEANPNVLGFLTRRQIGAGVISLEPKHSLMKRFIDYYSRDFITGGTMNVCDNTSVLTEFLQEAGIVMNRQNQCVGDVNIFSREYFYPKKISETEFTIYPETVAIHKASGSWMSDRQRKRGANKFWINICRPILCGIKKTLATALGKERTRNLEIFVRNKLR